jgi:hypothetical protein
MKVNAQMVTDITSNISVLNLALGVKCRWCCNVEIFVRGLIHLSLIYTFLTFDTKRNFFFTVILSRHQINNLVRYKREKKHAILLCSEICRHKASRRFEIHFPNLRQLSDNSYVWYCKFYQSCISLGLSRN